MSGDHLQSLPFVLRAPGRLTNCTTRVALLESLRRWQLSRDKIFRSHCKFISVDFLVTSSRLQIRGVRRFYEPLGRAKSSRKS